MLYRFHIYTSTPLLSARVCVCVWCARKCTRRWATTRWGCCRIRQHWGCAQKKASFCHRQRDLAVVCLSSAQPFARTSCRHRRCSLSVQFSFFLLFVCACVSLSVRVFCGAKPPFLLRSLGISPTPQCPKEGGIVILGWLCAVSPKAFPAVL